MEGGKQGVNPRLLSVEIKRFVLPVVQAHQKNVDNKFEETKTLYWVSQLK